jgi:hypothetical protein
VESQNHKHYTNITFCGIFCFMNNPVTFSSTGAHFRIADTEYQALNEVALRDEGAPLRELPIGRAAMVLRIILLAAAQDVIIQKEGSTVASTEMDGQEAATGALMQLFNPEIKHAVMDVGRVSVSVINDEEINDNNAVPNS